MTLDQILDLVGQIATWFTLVVVFLTLREMEKQRKSSQKPELIIPPVYFQGYVTKEESEKLLFPTEWNNGEYTGMNKHNSEAIEVSKDFPELKIFNIGFGAAKNVTLNWQIDHIQDAVSAIKDYAYENSFPLVVTYSADALGIKMDRRDIKFSGSPSQETRKYDYLLPASLTSSGLSASFPFPFTKILLPTLICLDLSRPNGKKLTPKENFVQIPSITLELSYDDIGNTRYIKKFKLELAARGYVVPRGKKLVKEVVFMSGYEFKESNT